MTATPTERFFLLLIKIFSILLFVAGGAIIASPLLILASPGLLGESQTMKQNILGQQMLVLFIMHGLAGGYFILTGVGYLRLKIWGPMCGIFLFVLALMLGAKGFEVGLPTHVRISYLGGGLLFCFLYMLPFFVWRHFYDVENSK